MIQMTIDDWSQFKTLVLLKTLQMQYLSKNDVYEVFALELDISWSISLFKGTADAIDFENNYLASSNQPLLGSSNTNFFNTSTTSVLKTGTGRLLRVVYSRTGGLGNTTWTLYDNTAASGTIIHQCTLGGNVASTILEFDSRFTNGLTIVTGSASHNITVIWK